jgi:hypothetical protein
MRSSVAIVLSDTLGGAGCCAALSCSFSCSFASRFSLATRSLYLFSTVLLPSLPSRGLALCRLSCSASACSRASRSFLACSRFLCSICSRRSRSARCSLSCSARSLFPLASRSRAACSRLDTSASSHGTFSRLRSDFCISSVKSGRFCAVSFRRDDLLKTSAFRGHPMNQKCWCV